MAPSFARDTEANAGRVTSVSGCVVDVRFPSFLPPIHALLHTESDGELAATGQAAPAHGSSTDALIRRYRELQEERP